jgi:YD repeat-containing protein
LKFTPSCDRFGNRTVDAAQTWGMGIPEPQFTVNRATIRLGVPSGYGGVMNYDFAGNLTYDSHSPTTTAGSRPYDAENRMTATYYMNNQFASGYTYDANGRRTRRKMLGSEVWQGVRRGWRVVGRVRGRCCTVHAAGEDSQKVLAPLRF